MILTLGLFKSSMMITMETRVVATMGGLRIRQANLIPSAKKRNNNNKVQKLIAGPGWSNKLSSMGLWIALWIPNYLNLNLNRSDCSPTKIATAATTTHYRPHSSYIKIYCRNHPANNNNSCFYNNIKGRWR